MKIKSLVFMLLIVLTAGSAFAGADNHWLHVRVDSHNGDGERVRVNIPLSVIRALLPAIQTNEFRGGRINLSAARIDGVDLHQVLTAFRDAPDANFVTIDSGDETVRVSKEKGYLIVKVDDDSEQVRVRLPLDVVDALLSSGDDEIDLLAALDALSNHDGDLISVTSDDESIRVWIDRDDDGE